MIKKRKKLKLDTKAIETRNLVIEASDNSDVVRADKSLNSHLDKSDDLKFEDCGDGVSYGAFVEGQADGIIKIAPGGKKKRAKSQRSQLVSFSFNRHSQWIFMNF